MKITTHKLSANDATLDVVNKQSGTFPEGLPDTIVLHYTAGPSLSSAVNTFKDPDVKACAHILIDRAGNITQMIPFNKISWHAGESSWLDRNGINKFSIGIEIVNAGRLEKSGNTWRSWFGKSFSEDEVVFAKHRNEDHKSWWHLYTEEQISASYELCNQLMKTYKIRYILGHEEISPGRKSDPGPAFPLDKLRERLLHSDRSDRDDSTNTGEKGVVTASALNIRSGPSPSHETIAKPLSRNTEVQVLKEQNGWYNVAVPITGWVSKSYIRKTE